MSFWNNKPLVITVLLVLVLLILIFATSGHSSENGMDSLVGRVVASVQEGLYGTTEGIGSFFGRIFAARDIDKENLQLKSEAAELQANQLKLEELEKENQRLRELLKVKDTLGDYTFLTARVIAHSPGSWLDEFIINAGTEDGIEKDMIVLTEDGIMGKVSSVGDVHSRVVTLMNSSGGIACFVERSREAGVVKVSSDANGGARLVIEYMKDGADVVPGDRIITSGMGGVYPKGLVIGTVSEVSTSQDAEKTIIVDSEVDFEHVEEVVVITQLFDEVVE